MTFVLAALNLVLGTAYSGYGVLTLLDMKRGWRTRGFSHFGAAWVFMAFTCGPHHLAHGYHLAFEGRAPGGWDVVAVAAGLPAGITWLLLRIEAFAGGRGDRFIAGTPSWARLFPPAAAAYLLLIGAAVGITVAGAPEVHFTTPIVPNLMLVWIYAAIGFFVWRTQFRNRYPAAGWSVSGVSLGIIFPTCALMHLCWVAYSVAGVYAFDVHAFVIDWLGVPAALYFLWVVANLYRGTLSDWNQPAEMAVAEPA